MTGLGIAWGHGDGIGMGGDLLLETLVTHTRYYFYPGNFEFMQMDFYLKINKHLMWGYHL